MRPLAVLLAATLALGACTSGGSESVPSPDDPSARTPSLVAEPASPSAADDQPRPTKKHTPPEEGITVCNKVVLPDEGVGEADFSINESDGTLAIHFSDTREGEYQNVSYVVKYLDDPTCRTTPQVAALIDRVNPPGWRR